MSLFSNPGASKPQQTTSLFGAPQNAASSNQAAPSLFGSAATASQPTAQTGTALGGGLFGGAAAGGQQNQGTSGGGLFAGIGASQAPRPATSSGSLFGGQSTAQPQQSQGLAGPSLFGGSGTTAQPQSTSGGGLFGNAATTQQSQAGTAGGLFGGALGAAKPQQPQLSTSTNLFGSTAGTSQGQNQFARPAAGNLTGSTLGQSAAGNLGSLAQTSAQPQQNGASGGQSAYFDHLLERGRKRNKQDEGDARFGDLPSLQLGLGDIAKKVRFVGMEESQKARGADTRAHYLLAASGVSTSSALRDLKSFAAQTGTAPTNGDQPAFDADVEGYLSNLQAQSTLALIAEGLEQSKRDFDAFLEDNVQMEWDAQRRRIYEHFGLVRSSGPQDSPGRSTATPTPQGSFGRSTRKSRFGSSVSPAASVNFGSSRLAKSVIGSGSVRNTGRPAVFADVADKAGTEAPVNDRFQRGKQEKLAEKIKQLNMARLQEVTYPLLHSIAEVEKESGADNMPQIVDALQALVEIAGENDKVERVSDPKAIKPRQYATDYLDENPSSAKSIAIRKRVLDGSRRYLEKQFFTQLEHAIAKNPREANLGGVPTSTNKVRAFIRLRAARKELGTDTAELQMLGEDYCWVLIFYLVRAGLVDEAAQYVRENERAIRSMDRNFPQYMTHFASSKERRLPPDLQAKINSEYQQRSRIAPENSVDPYRMACFKVLGRCEVSRRTLENVNQSMEDWVWLQFALAREAQRVEEAAGEVFGLEDLKVTITDIGQKHFASNSSDGSAGVGVFFFLQILAGMFEQAVAYLYPHNYIAAVHFAIALDFYGLLRVANLTASESDLLSFTTRQKPQINFGRMVGYYTRDFRAAKAEAATDYLALICLNADLPGPSGQSQAALCHEALRELVLETREFALLLGDIRSDGQRIKGAIERRLKLIRLDNEEEFLRTVTRQAASIADDCGRITDAVLLYHLAEDYDTVTSILGRALSDAVAVDLGQGPGRLEPLKPRLDDGAAASQQTEGSLSLNSVDDPVELARKMMALYDSSTMYWEKISQTTKAAVTALLQMSAARQLIEAGRWAKALDVINQLGLVPIETRGNVAAIRAMAQNFSSQPAVVARNIGNLLIWTITCCGRERESLLSSLYEDPTRQSIADGLLVIAKDLMVFAGLVRYKLSPRVFELLATAGQDVGV